MSTADPISRVAVVSTGAVAIRPEHVGPTNKSQTRWLLTSRSWTAPLPINVYVIEHECGLLLFDTGQDRASVTDRGYFPGGPLRLAYQRLARFEIRATDTLTNQLASAGFDIADVTTVVLSHLHQDHIGGLPELGGADILISAAERASLDRPGAAIRGLMLRHINLPGLKWKPLRFEPFVDSALEPFSDGFDIFGDGSLIILPTPGHTPGSVSLLVRRPRHAPLLLVGDLTYDVEKMEHGDVPGSGDRDQMRRSSGRVCELREGMPELVVLAAHDPSAAGRLQASLDAATSAES